jgi:Lon protease-like protein
MASSLEELPLFPLETVLFPHAALQLHIFEARYRQMVHECIEKDSPFGIVLIRSGEVVGGSADPFMIGTAVQIQQVNTYSDGQMDIQVVGERRFRIRRLDDSRPYLVGFVEPVVEAPFIESPETELLLTEAKSGFQELIQGILSKPDYSVQVVFPEDATALSFTIANLLQIDNREKQILLELTDTRERLTKMLPILQDHLDDIESYQEAYRSIPAPKVFKVSSDDLREWSGPN